MSGQDTFLDRGLLGGAARPSLVVESAGIVESRVRGGRILAPKKKQGAEGFWVTPQVEGGMKGCGGGPGDLGGD